MGVDMRSPPLIPGSAFKHKVTGDALALFLQDRMINSGLLLAWRTLFFEPPLDAVPD
jgi:hypothetical protein